MPDPRPRSARRLCRGLALALALLSAAPTLARDHYVAPPGGARGPGSGQLDSPWTSLWAALNSAEVRGGDRILLLPGTYGRVALQAPGFVPPLRILPAEPGTVHMDALRVDRGSGLTFTGLRLWPRAPGGLPPALVQTARGTARIRLEALELRGSPDAPSAYLGWGFEDWTRNWAPNGVLLRGAESGLFDSRLTGTNFGLTLEGDGATALGNRIYGFSGDAIRVLGDGSRIEDNEIGNCIKINDNHDDGIQSWANKPGGGQRQPVRDLVLVRNTILEWTGAQDHPLRCVLQGIGLFDGAFDGLRIENNIISVSAYHGIAVYGGRGVTILNNTVVHARGTPGTTHPWILVQDKKDGAPARDVRIAGNVAAGLISRMAQEPPRMTPRGNMILRQPIRLFPRLLEGDFRSVAPDNPLVDRADPSLAPPRDRFGTARPKGHLPDLGAIEWQ